MSVPLLVLSALFTPSNPAARGIEITNTSEGSENFSGQERTIETIEFEIGIRHEGYNLFAVGAQVKTGDFSADTINRRVEEQLMALA